MQEVITTTLFTLELVYLTQIFSKKIIKIVNMTILIDNR